MEISGTKEMSMVLWEQVAKRSLGDGVGLGESLGRSSLGKGDMDSEMKKEWGDGLCLHVSGKFMQKPCEKISTVPLKTGGQHGCSTWREDKVMIDWVRKAVTLHFPAPLEAGCGCGTEVQPMECEGSEARLILKEQVSVLYSLSLWAHRTKVAMRFQGREEPKDERSLDSTGEPRAICNVCLSCCVSEK